MIVYVALDDNNGMMFNKRRQSQDRGLRQQLLEDCKGRKLWMNEYTSKQFEEPFPENIMVDERFPDKMEEDDCCLVENLPLSPYENKIKKLIIYKWNRLYPRDLTLDINLAKEQWKIVEKTEFVGSSHDKITKEVWENGESN